MELLVGIIIIGIVWLISKIPEWGHDNRTCPPGKEIDWGKANHDLTVGGISKKDYYKRYNSGYYDKDKK